MIIRTHPKDVPSLGALLQILIPAHLIKDRSKNLQVLSTLSSAFTLEYTSKPDPT
jgi:hypothetical protein